ncbi:MAG: CNNM domain-containing protein [Pseudomonadota bacterium]
MILLSVLLVLALLAISSCFAAIETAVTAASVGRIQKAKTAGDIRAVVVLKLLKIKEKVISSLLVFNSLINTIATTIATSVIIGIYGEEHGTIIASIVMSIMIIVFAEVVPKAIAVAKAESIILISSSFVDKTLLFLRPVNFILNLILRAFCFIFRIKFTQDISGAEEVRGIIEHHHSEGNVFTSDRDMLGGVLDIGNITVDEIMIHRFHITSINADLPVKEITAQALNSSHTRIPLWRDSTDNIVGILHIKDLVKSLYRSNFDYAKISIKDFITEPWFIPENALASQQLHAFKQKRSHFALVIDEYGDLKGMLTLEDVLEEIVGQIDDEHDSVKRRIREQDKNRFIIDGSMSIRDLNRELGWNLPDEDANTLAGLVMHHMHKLPEQGEILEILNFRITISKRLSNRIKTLTVEVKPDEDIIDDRGSQA